MPSSAISSLLNACNLEDLQLHLQRFPSAIRELNNEGFSALHEVMVTPCCTAAIVKLLLGYGADPNFNLGGNGSTPLYLALFCRDRVGIVRALVEGGARAEQPAGCMGVMSLALKLNAGLEVVKLLMSAGADLFSMDIFGVSPLFHAVQFFNVSVFRSLLDLQDVDINNSRNLRMENGGECSLLHRAVCFDTCTAVFVKLLIDRGIRVNSVDGFRNTPLHFAVQNPTCHLDVVDVLLRRGSLVNVQNQNGETPLDIAIGENCSQDIIQLLLKYCLLEDPDFDVEDRVRGHELEEMVLSYANDCKREGKRMNSENVGNGRTLLGFLHTYHGSQLNRDEAEGFNVDQLLQIIAEKLYPLYSSVISSKLERSLLINKLREFDLFTVVESSDVRCVTKKVLLKDDCVHILATYLDDNDLLNMILAFCN